MALTPPNNPTLRRRPALPDLPNTLDQVLEWTAKFERAMIDALDTLTEWTESYKGARMQNSADISLGSGSITALTFDTVVADTGGFVTATDRFTIQEAGWYVIGASARFAANATGNRQLMITLNGTSTQLANNVQAGTAANSQHFSVAVAHYCNRTDYLHASAFQNSGGSLNVTAVANSSPVFWIHYLGQ